MCFSNNPRPRDQAAPQEGGEGGFCAMISSNELKMDPEKVKAIREWSSPRNIFEVRRFHGLASFYQNFIKSFSVISAQMMDTVNKIQKAFKWTEEDERSFNILKEKIV
jgi:hypothetical protein